jgi:hypothetical protein
MRLWEKEKMERRKVATYFVNGRKQDVALELLAQEKCQLLYIHVDTWIGG